METVQKTPERWTQRSWRRQGFDFLCRASCSAFARWISCLWGRWNAFRVVASRDIAQLRAHGLETPVIVVGGLSFGGSGQTPVVAELAFRALLLGLRPGILGHGYGGRGSGFVSADAACFGDEAVALWTQFEGRVPVAVGAQFLAELSRRCDVVLCDGGLWNRRLWRSGQVIVLDATAPFRAFPAGPLRASLSAVAHADVTWLHKTNEPGAALPEVAVQMTSHVSICAVLCDGKRFAPEVLLHQKVSLICGVARPDSVVYALRALGAQVTSILALSDHANLEQAETQSFFQKKGESLLVTTTKDFARWPAHWPTPFVLEMRLETKGDWSLVDALLRGVC